MKREIELVPCATDGNALPSLTQHKKKGGGGLAQPPHTSTGAAGQHRVHGSGVNASLVAVPRGVITKVLPSRPLPLTLKVAA